MKKLSLYWKSRSSIWINGLLLIFAFSAQADQFVLSGQYPGAAYEHTMDTWQLRNLRTISKGQVTYPKEGTLTRQYELQADAESTSGSTGAPLRARFRLLMDVFFPANGTGGQKKGKYYIQGLWELVGESDVLRAVDDALSSKIQGRVQAELAFDPTSVNRGWKGSVRIPISRVRSNDRRLGVRLMRGGGELAFTPGDGGTLAFDLKLWPKL